MLEIIQALLQTYGMDRIPDRVNNSGNPWVIGLDLRIFTSLSSMCSSEYSVTAKRRNTQPVTLIIAPDFTRAKFEVSANRRPIRLQAELVGEGSRLAE